MIVPYLQKLALAVFGTGLIGAASASGQAGPVPAAAQAKPATAPATAPLPGNRVQCVYEYMGTEDREMALLLLAREIADGGRFRKTSPNVMAVDRLIEEAHEKCLARFNWSVARSDAATGYALAAILAEALRQALDTFGYPVAPLETYWTDNRNRLAARNILAASDQDQLSAFLRERGWEAAEDDELSLAALYLETRLLQEQAERRFSYYSGPARKPIRKPPVRGGKAKRGKP